MKAAGERPSDETNAPARCCCATASPARGCLINLEAFGSSSPGQAKEAAGRAIGRQGRSQTIPAAPSGTGLAPMASPPGNVAVSPGQTALARMGVSSSSRARMLVRHSGRPWPRHMTQGSGEAAAGSLSGGPLQPIGRLGWAGDTSAPEVGAHYAEACRHRGPSKEHQFARTQGNRGGGVDKPIVLAAIGGDERVMGAGHDDAAQFDGFSALQRFAAHQFGCQSERRRQGGDSCDRSGRPNSQLGTCFVDPHGDRRPPGGRRTAGRSRSTR